MEGGGRGPGGPDHLHLPALPLGTSLGLGGEREAGRAGPAVSAEALRRALPSKATALEEIKLNVTHRRQGLSVEVGGEGVLLPGGLNAEADFIKNRVTRGRKRREKICLTRPSCRHQIQSFSLKPVSHFPFNAKPTISEISFFMGPRGCD